MGEDDEGEEEIEQAAVKKAKQMIESNKESQVSFEEKIVKLSETSFTVGAGGSHISGKPELNPLWRSRRGTGGRS